MNDAELPTLIPYTHVVITSDGRQFSIHKSAADAQVRANQVKGTVAPFTLNPTAYWTENEGEPRYDH